ncbi:hypothetical protein EDB89DRAFT_1975199 [Lactarius sanguifluus]|nr:hypothetical protein EDB89DRAFT_1975199 [Lactarius sanguifluus]
MYWPVGRFLSLFLSLLCNCDVCVDLASCNVNSMENTAMRDPFQVKRSVRSRETVDRTEHGAEHTCALKVF